MTSTLCGLWIASDGTAHECLRTPDDRRVERTVAFRPFAWSTAAMAPVPESSPASGMSVETLAGGAIYDRLVHAETLDAYQSWLVGARSHANGADALRPLESQYLLQTRQRLYAELPFAQLRRCQVDIETGSEDGTFSDPSRAGDRVLAIGLRVGERTRLLVLETPTDEGERALLHAFTKALAEEDPDTIEGHNVFKFDLDYLRVRSKRLKVPFLWGRFGQKASWRSSRLKVAERWIDFPRCDIPGRAVVDTYLLVQLYDISTRELTSYGLKDVAVYFGLTPDDARETGGRTYLDGGRIQETFERDRERFLAYLADDLRETRGIADRLLPTYFEQARTFPIQLQDATLRGTTAKIDLLFLEEYYHARQSCPAPADVQPFEGGFTKSFKEGVFRHVLHFDVASLYPSLLLTIGRNPINDALGVFIPLLTKLRTYRLRYKQLAKSADTEIERLEAQARQANFKILINSFYGYLGFSGARFGDGDLAAEVTRQGRELLQRLIAEFEKNGCIILEADTDGIYLSSPEYYDDPRRLLERVAPVLPPGIELEFDGRYEGMFCYKAKNYALYDGSEITLRGSALRSRGIEPYLKQLSDELIAFLLGASSQSPVETARRFREEIVTRTMPVERLAKTENLSQSPDAYERFVEGGGKPRRSSAEAALQLSPRPNMGESVTYYITPRQKGRTNDWQRARPASLYHAVSAPYDTDYYVKKMDDWLERYAPFLGQPSLAPQQSELALE